MRKIAIIFIIICLSCSKRTETKTSDSIDLNKIDKVSVNDLFQSIDVVQLETNNQCLIAHVTKVIFYNDRYYIFDVRQQAILCFDSTGKFLFNISRRGQGPEEYIYMEEFNIDTFTQELLLLEPFGSLLTFDLEGKFISKKRLLGEIIAYNEVYPVNKDTLLFRSLNKYSFATYSKSKNLIIDKVEGEISDNIFSPLHKTYVYNDQIFFSIPATNDIVNLSDNSLFSWDFGDRNNTRKQIRNVKKLIESEPDSYIRGTIDFVKEKKLNYSIMYNYETFRYKICILDYGNPEFRHVFFDKKTNQSVVFDKTTEDIQFLIPFLTGESLIIAEHSFKYKFYDDSLLSEEQRKIIFSHNEDDNPFLVKYNFKK